MLKKRIIIVCISILLCGLGIKIYNHEKIKAYAIKGADIIMGGDMQEINNIIYGYSEYEVTQELQTSNEQGILEEIFKRVSIDVKSVKSNKIEYEITAPDLSRIFDELIEQNLILSEEEFREYIGEYILHAELKTEVISISYDSEDRELKANYQDREFINAITGGLVESYQKVYQKMINDFWKGNI